MVKEIQSVSQLYQDGIVLKLLGYKNNGIFVDIGCAEPIRFSNSYLMEKYFNWSGIGIDILDASDKTGSWSTLRPNTKHILGDALALDYSVLFKQLNLPKTIDYLSLDLEPPQLTLDCLYKIPFNEYTFNVITFETDEYRENGSQRAEESRKYLTSLGYTLQMCLNRQDDVYVHSSFIGNNK
jgi:hypothetical protein